MKKKSKYRFLLVLLTCIVLAFAGFLFWSLLQKQENLKAHTVIKIRGETTKTLHADLDGFYPGSEQSYEIALSGESPETYEITLHFRSAAGSGNLGDYLLVTIRTKEVTIEKQLKDLLGGKKVSLGTNANEITITYTMPESTGNEAQGATADFYIDLMAKNTEQNNQ